MVLEFIPAPGVTVGRVYTSFSSTEGAGGARKIAIGDIFSEEVRQNNCILRTSYIHGRSISLQSMYLSGVVKDSYMHNAYCECPAHLSGKGRAV